MPKRGNKKSKGQCGGSAWVHPAHSFTAVGGPAAISNATLEVINQAPMFNPLSDNTIIPGPSGVVPSGLYLGAQSQGASNNNVPAGNVPQSGGAEKRSLLDIELPHLRDLCNALGFSCRNQKGDFLTKKQLVQKIQKIQQSQ
jgi:hypothetical protein